MICIRSLFLAFASVGLISGLSVSEVTADTPVADILTSAINHLSAGHTSDAIALFSQAISRQPDDFSTIFKRGSIYLSLGRHAQALQDFDQVLKSRPDFAPALSGRAKIRLQSGNVGAAERDYKALKVSTDGPEWTSLQTVKDAAIQSQKAEDSKNWEKCVHSTTSALEHAPRAHSLRERRIRCQLSRADFSGASTDLQFLASRDPTPEIFAQASAVLFFMQNQRDRGMDQIRKCLQSDPDSKRCMKIFKLEKAIHRDVGKVEKLKEGRKYVNAAGALVGKSDTDSIIDRVQSALRQCVDFKLLPESSLSNSQLQSHLTSLACELFVQANHHTKAKKFCEDVFSRDSSDYFAILNKAQLLVSSKQYEAAIQLLQSAKGHLNDRKLGSLYNTAQQHLRVSKQKDYYKALNLDRDADEGEIKKAYRKMLRDSHPDKVPEDQRPAAEKKMADINEAYEVLSDPELKARYDQGDDPNDTSGGGGAGGHPGGPHPGAAFFAGHPMHNFFQGAGGGQQFKFFTGPGGQGQRKGGGSGSFQFDGNAFHFG